MKVFCFRTLERKWFLREEVVLFEMCECQNEIFLYFFFDRLNYEICTIFI